jgi:hypothetical protein
MKKILIQFFAFVFFINSAFAASPGTTTASALTVPCPGSICSMDDFIELLTKIIVPAASLGLLLIIVYGGFTKLTAAGDAEKEKKAMQIIQNAIVGFIIIALATTIVATIGGLLGYPLFN